MEISTKKISHMRLSFETQFKWPKMFRISPDQVFDG